MPQGHGGGPGRRGSRSGDGMNGRGWSTGLALFGETVITGVLVGVLALPVVTALPALAAGVRHLRRHLAGESVRLGSVWQDFTAAWRALWRAALGLTGAALLLLWNLSLAETGLLPGGAAVRAVSLALLAGWLVLLLRTAAVWRPGTDAAGALREAAARAGADPAGSLLLLLACGLCAVFVWMLLPLVVLAGGLLSLAAVAVDVRGAGRAAAPEED